MPVLCPLASALRPLCVRSASAPRPLRVRFTPAPQGTPQLPPGHLALAAACASHHSGPRWRCGTDTAPPPPLPCAAPHRSPPGRECAAARRQLRRAPPRRCESRPVARHLPAGSAPAHGAARRQPIAQTASSIIDRVRTRTESGLPYGSAFQRKVATKRGHRTRRTQSAAPNAMRGAERETERRAERVQ